MQDGGSHITLGQAAKLSPGRPSSCAVWRWCRVGIKSRNGERIRLSHIRAGGRIFTTEAALTEFFEHVTKADREHFDAPPTPPPPPKGRTSGQRKRSVQAAEQVLREGGIL